MLDVCCGLTPYETSRWLKLKPDSENVTRSGTEALLMARTQRQTEYIAMIETGNESQPSAQLLLLSNGAIVVGCTEVLFQPSFSLCCSTCCPRSMRRTTRWLRYGVGEQSTMRITRPCTAQSERALVRLIDTSSLQAVSIKPKESCTCHPCIDCVTSCVVLLVLHAHHYTRSSRISVLF